MKTGDPDTKDRLVCAECVGDEYLKAWVRKQQREAECSYCSLKTSVLAVCELSEKVHEVMTRDFVLTAREPSGWEYALYQEFGTWDRPGEFVGDIICDLIGGSTNVTDDVQRRLSSLYGYDRVKDGEEDPYGDDALYEEREPEESYFLDTWNEFRAQLRHRARFFGANRRSELSEIFGDLTDHAGWGGTPVVRELRAGAEDAAIFRGRLAQTLGALEGIMASPEALLGSPPARCADSGRMNPAGIPVFYGALDPDTCVAELRPPVGSHVVIGRFDLLRPVRLLDCRVLLNLRVPGSRFDPEFPSRLGRAAFLQRFVHEISRPVMPGTEEIEYLPTQVVAEYLASCVEPKIDGILFPSTQRDGEGYNVALFNHASGSAPGERPAGTSTVCEINLSREDDDSPSVAVFDELPAGGNSGADGESAESGERMAGVIPCDGNGDGVSDAWLPEREPYLKLVRDELMVRTVTSVAVASAEWIVTRIEMTKGEKEEY